MTQVWDDQNRAVPVTVLKVAPVRVVQVKTPETDGYAALQVTWGFRRNSTLTKPQLGHYAKAGVNPGPGAGGTAARRRGRLHGRPGAGRRPVGGRRAGGRHRREQGQGLRRRHEAPQLQGPGRLARKPPQPPRAGGHRRLRHAVACLQGHPHGRPDGRHPGDGPEPRGGVGRRRARAGPGQGRRARGPGQRRGAAQLGQGPDQGRGGRDDGRRHGHGARPARCCATRSRKERPGPDHPHRPAPQRGGPRPRARWTSSRPCSAWSPTAPCCTRSSRPSWPPPGPARSRPRPGPRCAAAAPSRSARRGPAGPARVRAARRP